MHDRGADGELTAVLISVCSRMKATQQLRDLGQSLWLDNITRALLNHGTLRYYIDTLSVTGLTSNPTIFDNAIRISGLYGSAIRQKAGEGKSGEDIFYALALEDLTQAADMFRPIHRATDGVDGWVSLEVSPLLADDTAGSVASALKLHAQAGCPNLMIKLPGTAAGIAAVEECIFRGIPVNVTLLFSAEQYLAAAEAYLRGIERRLAAGLDPAVASIASMFVSRWDVAVQDKVTGQLRNRLGIAVANQVYRSYRTLVASARWKGLSAAGARLQRLLWASTGTKDPTAADTLYVEALAAPDTINTMPDSTLRAFAAHGRLDGVMPPDGGDADDVLATFSNAGVNVPELAARLQREGAEAFARSWRGVLARIANSSTGAP
jgi:transaldolase